MFIMKSPNRLLTLTFMFKHNLRVWKMSTSILYTGWSEFNLMQKIKLYWWTLNVVPKKITSLRKNNCLKLLNLQIVLDYNLLILYNFFYLHILKWKKY